MSESVHRAANNAKWLALAQLLKVSAQLCSMIFLARLIPLEGYGIIALAFTVINFLALFRDFGLGSSLIQTNDISDEKISFINAICIVVGIIFGALTIFAAYIYAYFYNEPKLIYVLLVLAATFPIMGASTVHQALMEREGQFKKVAFIEVLSQIVALVLALILANAGFAEKSIAYQSLIYAIISALGFVSLNKYKVGFSLKYIENSGLEYGGNLSAFNLVNYLSRNADVLILSKFFSSAVIGSYSMAYKLMLLPVQSITFVASRAIFPILSRLQTDHNAAARLFINSTSVVAFLAFPVLIGFWISRADFYHLVMGDKWRSASALSFWLAPTGLVQALVSTTGAVFMSQGKTSLLFYLGVCGAVLQVSAFIIGVFHGPETVVFLYFIANVLNSVIVMRFALSLLDIKFKELFSSLTPSLLSSFIMALFYCCISSWSGRDVIRYSVSVLGCILIYLSVFYVCFPVFFRRIYKGLSA